MTSEQIAETLMDTYQGMSVENVDQIRSMYAPDIRFEDPAHHIEGIEALVEYFRAMYKNVNECSFEFHDHLVADSSLVTTWTMTIRHPKLNGNEPVHVEGCSHLRIEDGLVAYHRDYFDLGSMLYEHLPVLGRIVRTIKGRLGQ